MTTLASCSPAHTIDTCALHALHGLVIRRLSQPIKASIHTHP